MKKIILMLSLICGIITSCQNNNDESMLSSEEIGIMNFVYEDIFYSSEYSIINNEKVLLDEDVNYIYQNLIQLPELLTVVGDTLLFFNTKEDYMNAIKYEENEIIQTKATPNHWWILSAYTTVNYKGVEEYYSDKKLPCQYQQITYNNNWGALVMSNHLPVKIRFIFYEEKNCQGNSLVYEVESGATIAEHDLRRCLRDPWLRNWDNHISSFTVL